MNIFQVLFLVFGDKKNTTKVEYPGLVFSIFEKTSTEKVFELKDSNQTLIKHLRTHLLVWRNPEKRKYDIKIMKDGRKTTTTSAKMTKFVPRSKKLNLNEILCFQICKARSLM